jgi:hypothetical protein
VASRLLGILQVPASRSVIDSCTQSAGSEDSAGRREAVSRHLRRALGPPGLPLDPGQVDQRGQMVGVQPERRLVRRAGPVRSAQPLLGQREIELGVGVVRISPERVAERVRRLLPASGTERLHTVGERSFRPGARWPDGRRTVRIGRAILPGPKPAFAR